MDLEKATYTNDVGSTELKTVWTDPEFDSSLHAFYYARVLEIPTPRWTLIQAVKAGLTPPDVVPLTGQERAWSSPIWYTPSAEARKNAPVGMTVTDLKAKASTDSPEKTKALKAYDDARDELKVKLTDLGNATEATWADAKAGVSKAWDKVESAYADLTK